MVFSEFEPAPPSSRATFQATSRMRARACRWGEQRTYGQHREGGGTTKHPTAQNWSSHPPEAPHRSRSPTPPLEDEPEGGRHCDGRRGESEECRGRSIEPCAWIGYQAPVSDHIVPLQTSARRGGGEGGPGRAFAGELARIPSPRCPMGDDPALTRSVIVVVVSTKGEPREPSGREA